MKKYVIAAIVLFVFCSCAAGPVYVAKNDAEGIKQVYADRGSQELYNKNVDLFRDIYLRFSSAGVGVYPGGLGVTTLKDQNNEVLTYLMVNVRPAEISFDMNTTKGEQRFSHALQQVPRYMKIIKGSDLNRKDIAGLAFGVYWPVRDFSQCQKNGGFIEYLYVYLKKGDAQDVLAGRRDYMDVLNDAEIYTSWNLQPAKSVRPVF